MSGYLRLARSGQPGYEKPSIVLDDSSRRDVSILVSEIDEAALRGPWQASLATISPDALPAVAPGARLAAPVERVKRVFRISGNMGDIGTDTRFGEPAGPQDPFHAAGLGNEFLVSAGIAAIMGSSGQFSGLAMFTDVIPLPSNGRAIDRLRCSRHGLWALGPYILAPDEMQGIESAIIHLSIHGATGRITLECTLVPGDIGAIVGPVHEACPLDAGDILLIETAEAPLFAQGFVSGDLIEASAGRLGTQSRLFV